MSQLIPLLMNASGLTELDIRRIARNAPIRYKTYEIPKRNGGTRTISQPARELKALQRAIVFELLRKRPVHPSAMAYRAGISIRDNAAAHAQNGPILKFDFKDFFPSIVAHDWISYCQKTSLFDEFEDVLLSTNILFHRPKRGRNLRLAIGAPSSPCLSNILMYDFDDAIARAVARDSVTYTRYADDLTFSARRTGYLTGVERALRTVIREIGAPSLKINEEKTVTATLKYKRWVTGLILTNDHAVSIGHGKKKRLRAAVHRAMLGQLQQAELSHLGGLLAFVQGVEPSFLDRLKQKYSANLIANIMATNRSS